MSETKKLLENMQSNLNEDEYTDENKYTLDYFLNNIDINPVIEAVNNVLNYNCTFELNNEDSYDYEDGTFRAIYNATNVSNQAGILSHWLIPRVELEFGIDARAKKNKRIKGTCSITFSRQNSYTSDLGYTALVAIYSPEENKWNFSSKHFDM